MNDEPISSNAPAPVVSQTLSAGASVHVRRKVIQQLIDAFPEVPADVVERKCEAVYRTLRAVIIEGPLNNEVENIVRSALKRGVSSRELAKQFLAVAAPQGTA